jgi:P27 family predicted phage terminase small subunit
MSLSGRPPKSTQLKILQGTYRPSRDTKKVQIQGLNTPPKPPKTFKKTLHPKARSEWLRVAPALVGAGLLSNLDLVALECYCLAYERMLCAEEILAQTGLTFTSPKGFIMQRPEVSIASMARKEVREFLVQFGMTPASRARVSAKPRDEGEIDPMEELLNASG